MGPLMLDLAAYELQSVERELLAHPTTGGVILFSRNYHDSEQLMALVSDIRKAAGREILIAVDHEGGRVQRFRTEPFTALPAMGHLGRCFADSPDEALQLTQDCGWLLCAELAACDIDLSFAPVLDLDLGSRVIGDRAFSDDPNTTVSLATALITGMREAGMASVGKHFPGHGSVEADSHVDVPVDQRSFADIVNRDMSVFRQLIEQQLVDAIMPAHVIFEQVDAHPAGFSRFWLQEVLRAQLNFNGVIFSDDLSMEGAGVAGDHLQRAHAALEAGCDMLLACNHRKGAEHILDGLPHGIESRALSLFEQGRAVRARYQWQELNRLPRRLDIQRRLAALF